MIKEICSIEDFDKAAEEWNIKSNFTFWTSSLASSKNHRFNPDSIEQKLRFMFLEGLNNPEAKDKVKIWSYEKNKKSIAGCVFVETYNFLLGENCLQEILWQFNGKFANSFEEIKILNALFKNAENYATTKKLDSIVIGRDPKIHKPCKEIQIKNFYTNQGYHPFSVFYIKSLK